MRSLRNRQRMGGDKRHTFIRREYLRDEELGVAV